MFRFFSSSSFDQFALQYSTLKLVKSKEEKKLHKSGINKAGFGKIKSNMLSTSMAFIYQAGAKLGLLMN